MYFYLFKFIEQKKKNEAGHLFKTKIKIIISY